MAFNKARALQEAEKSLAQGRIVEAAQKYLDIVENDPSDLPAVNLAGDLCVRANNMPEALRLFRKLAESYVQEGYIPRAIAIYKKLLKLDSSNVAAMLRLGELYSGQALNREARDLYAQALAICQDQKLHAKALEAMRRISAAEPSNLAHRSRLAELYKAAGQMENAFNVHLETAEVARAQSDYEGMNAALGSAEALRPDDPQIHAFHQRLSPQPAGSEAGLRDSAGEAPAGPGTPVPESVAEPAPTAIHSEGTGAETGRELSEIDLSDDWESLAAGPPGLSATFDPEDLSIEIEFYLGHGMASKAFEKLEQLEGQFPGDMHLANLRKYAEERRGSAAGARSMLGRSAPNSKGSPEVLKHEFESSAHHPAESGAVPRFPASPSFRPDFAASLGALLTELETEAASPPNQSDPQTHYELGIAFREMGLVDEAIGELQKAVRKSRPGANRERFLSACSLLALSFAEKQMPALAVKWYTRALQVPDLDPDVLLALQYDLGLAYELAGNLEAARENFLEVYGQNIEYRDVAAKVRKLAANRRD